MIKRVLSILFLLLSNSIILGHSIIIHHHHPLALEEFLHAEHEGEHHQHHGNHDNSIEVEHDIPAHCHLFSRNELYLTYLSQSNQSIEKKQLINYYLIGFEQNELDKNFEANYVNYNLTLSIKSLHKQGALCPRGPPNT